MSLWKRTTPTTISRLHPYPSRPSGSATRSPSMPKAARGFAAKPRNSEGDKSPHNHVLHPPTQSEDVVVAGSEG